MPSCKSCGAEILWAETQGGKMMPLDAAETAIWAPWHSPQSSSGSKQYWQQICGHVTHFATCPNAAKHRRPKGEPNAA